MFKVNQVRRAAFRMGQVVSFEGDFGVAPMHRALVCGKTRDYYENTRYTIQCLDTDRIMHNVSEKSLSKP